VASQLLLRSALFLLYPSQKENSSTVLPYRARHTSGNLLRTSYIFSMYGRRRLGRVIVTPATTLA